MPEVGTQTEPVRSDSAAESASPIGSGQDPAAVIIPRQIDSGMPNDSPSITASTVSPGAVAERIAFVPQSGPVPVASFRRPAFTDANSLRLDSDGGSVASSDSQSWQRSVSESSIASWSSRSSHDDVELDRMFYPYDSNPMVSLAGSHSSLDSLHRPGHVWDGDNPPARTRSEPELQNQQVDPEGHAAIVDERSNQRLVPPDAAGRLKAIGEAAAAAGMDGTDPYRPDIVRVVRELEPVLSLPPDEIFFRGHTGRLIAALHEIQGLLNNTDRRQVADAGEVYRLAGLPWPPRPEMPQASPPPTSSAPEQPLSKTAPSSTAQQRPWPEGGRFQSALGSTVAPRLTIPGARAGSARDFVGPSVEGEVPGPRRLPHGSKPDGKTLPLTPEEVQRFLAVNDKLLAASRILTFSQPKATTSDPRRATLEEELSGMSDIFTNRFDDDNQTVGNLERSQRAAAAIESSLRADHAGKVPDFIKDMSNVFDIRVSKAEDSRFWREFSATCRQVKDGVKRHVADMASSDRVFSAAGGLAGEPPRTPRWGQRGPRRGFH